MCLKALGLDVELIKLDMYQKYEHKKPWFIKMNPQHTVPTINDSGYILWESRAIMCYLVNKYNNDDLELQSLYPKDPETRGNIDKLLFFDIGSLYKSIVDYFHPMLMTGEGSDEKKANALKTALDYLDGFLSEQTFVVGETLTIADLSILSSITQLEALDFKITGYKHLFRWLQKLKEDLPYFEECNKEGIEMFRSWARSKQGSNGNAENLPLQKKTIRCKTYD